MATDSAFCFICAHFFFRFNDIDKATKSKSALEHNQREEARIRKESNVKWETKVGFSLLKNTKRKM